MVYIFGKVYPPRDGLDRLIENLFNPYQNIVPRIVPIIVPKEIRANTSESLIVSYVNEQMIKNLYNESDGMMHSELRQIRQINERCGTRGDGDTFFFYLYAAYFWYKSIELVKEIDVIGLLQQQQIKINPNDGGKLPNGFS